jgi:hypothetical protein
MSRLIHPCETPEPRATQTGWKPASTAVMTSRRLEEFETTQPVEPGHADDLRHAIGILRPPFRCPEPAHCRARHILSGAPGHAAGADLGGAGRWPATRSTSGDRTGL